MRKVPEKFYGPVEIPRMRPLINIADKIVLNWEKARLGIDETSVQNIFFLFPSIFKFQGITFAWG
jgi:hypothetical protein